MIPIAAAIVERLSGMDYLQRTLAKYGDSKGLAIFTASSIPEDATYPYVWSPAEYQAIDYDAKNAALATLFRDVSVYAIDAGSDQVVEELAWCIRRALHKQPLRLDVDQNVVLNAAPPIVAPTADGILGRLVQLRLVISEG